MHIGGRLGADAPDPALERLATVRAFGFPVAGLVAQRHLEQPGEVGYSTTGGGGLVTEAVVSRTYSQWRNPDDRGDPANLTQDARPLAELGTPPKRAIPPWLTAARERLRFPMLWEAVQTHWWADPADRRGLPDLLVSHAEHILHNRFSEELGIPFGEWHALVPVGAVQSCAVIVDGEPAPGLMVDTDPFVFAFGAALDDGRVVTVVVPRDELPLLRLELVSEAPL